MAHEKKETYKQIYSMWDLFGFFLFWFWYFGPQTYPINIRLQSLNHKISLRLYIKKLVSIFIFRAKQKPSKEKRIKEEEERQKKTNCIKRPTTTYYILSVQSITIYIYIRISRAWASACPKARASASALFLCVVIHHRTHQASFSYQNEITFIANSKNTRAATNTQWKLRAKRLCLL